jgi:hypothetical protein
MRWDWQVTFCRRCGRYVHFRIVKIHLKMYNDDKFVLKDSRFLFFFYSFTSDY